MFRNIILLYKLRTLKGIMVLQNPNATTLSNAKGLSRNLYGPK